MEITNPDVFIFTCRLPSAVVLVDDGKTVPDVE